jgi:CRP-like cAMP-binding protein
MELQQSRTERPIASRERPPSRTDSRRRWPPGALVRSLQRYAPLGAEERSALNALTSRLVRCPPRAEVIEAGGAPPRDVVVVCGYACRYKLRPSGERQILQILMPGDVCHGDAERDVGATHAVGALTDLYVARPPREALARIAERFPAVARALALAALAERAMLLEWIAAAGRPAESRLAHLLCELSVRMASLGLAAGRRAVPPLSQVALAQALGLTPVHLNRLVQKLRREGLIESANRGLAIVDFERLRALGEFDAGYLRLSGGAAAH